jgi:murein DD-endopeptidase MepM/ murein hydrolase activator NlpD
MALLLLSATSEVEVSEATAVYTGFGFSVMVVDDEGRRVGRLTVPRWVVRSALGVAAIALAGNVALIGHYTVLRRAQVAGVSAPIEQAASAEVAVAPAALDQRPPTDPPPAPVDAATVREELAAVRQQLAAARGQLAQKGRTLEPLERRIAEIRDEIRGWDGLHAAILKPLANEVRVRPVGGSERTRGKHEGPLDAVNSVLSIVRHESNRLRGLARITRETGEFLASVPSRAPLRAAINSGFGMRPDPFGVGGRQFHAGIDFSASTGTPVSAAAGGVVRVAGTASGYGNTILLDHGRGFETRYGHLHSIGVTPGQRVERGQPIGLSGNTGRSTAPHLHYEVLVDGRPVDPRRLIRN